MALEKTHTFQRQLKYSMEHMLRATVLRARDVQGGGGKGMGGREPSSHMNCRVPVSEHREGGMLGSGMTSQKITYNMWRSFATGLWDTACFIPEKRPHLSSSMLDSLLARVEPCVKTKAKNKQNKTNKPRDLSGIAIRS